MANSVPAPTPGYAVPPVGPPPRQSDGKSTLWQDLQQGVEYIKFVVTVAQRIRGWGNRVRFVVGIVLWKPILPREDR